MQLKYAKDKGLIVHQPDKRRGIVIQTFFSKEILIKEN